MKIQVLVAAFEDSIALVPGLVASVPASTGVLVVHQVADPAGHRYDRLFSGNNVEVVPMMERGLAVSRNRAASLATADVVIPTDADVRFLPGAIDVVAQSLAGAPDALIGTFQIQTPEGLPYKQYAAGPYRHSYRTIRRVSSIEIAVRRLAFTEHGLRWDTRFGLNARYPGGLEQAFMANGLDLGLPAHYFPRPIVTHPRVSTGHRHSVQSAFFRGAVYARLHGSLAYPLLAAFALRNAWRTGSLPDALRYTSNLYRGARDFRGQPAGGDG